MGEELKLLTDNHISLLNVIDRREKMAMALLSGRELCAALGQQPGWAGPKLTQLADAGLIETAGVTISSAGTWRITDEGRKFLSQKDVAA